MVLKSHYIYLKKMNMNDNILLCWSLQILGHFQSEMTSDWSKKSIQFHPKKDMNGNILLRWF